MKRILSAVAITVSLIAASACARAGDQTISINQLPDAGQTLVSTFFTGKTVAVVKKDVELSKTSYEVIFTDGDKIELNADGEWTEVECKSGTTVPDGLVPAQIASYVSANYPAATIIEIEKDRRGYEVKLSNGLEIDFNKNFEVTDISA